MSISLNHKEIRYRRHRWLPLWARLVHTLIFFLITSSVQAAYTPLIRMNSLELPGAVWDRGESMAVSDVPLHVRSFSSARQPVHLAQALAGHIDIFQRILTTRHKIILSGLQPGWHWLAHIDATPEGSKGYVSALYVDAARLNSGGHIADSGPDPSVTHDPVYRWLPASAHRRFGHHAAASSQALTQHIYSVPVTADRVVLEVALGLATQGWQADVSAGKGAGPHIWSYKDQILMVFAYPETQGSTVLVHHSQKAPESGPG